MTKHSKYFFNSIFSITFSLFWGVNISVSQANEVADLEQFKVTQIEIQSEGNLSNDSERIDSNANNTKKANEIIELGDLRVPDAPALSIIGSPKIEISKPGTARAFGLSLIESFTDSESGLPGNLAIDLTPYWWSEKPLNTVDDEICRPSSQEGNSPDCNPIGFGESLLRSLTISIASSQEDLELAEENTDITRLGLGLRFSLLTGQINSAFRRKYKSFPREYKCVDKLVDGKWKPFDSIEEQEQCLEKHSDKLSKLVQELRVIKANRVGWQLDFALASALDFSEDNFDNAEFTRLGTWLTASYQPENSQSNASSITFLGIARYIYDDFGNQANDLFDLGGRILWNPTDNPLSTSVEYLRRFGNDDDDRLVGLAEYKFNDTYSIFASFGKTFEEDFTGNDDLVTLLGINFGLGQKPKALVDP